MKPSPLRLLDWAVPTMHHRYTRRDTAFYALSLGFGSSPLDRRHLRLVDPWAPSLVALPSMALVLAYPGFWLGEPAVRALAGIEPWQVLHVQQDVQLARALPVEGEVIGETRVTAIVDKGPGRASLLESTRRIHDASSGQLLATCTQVHYLRDAGGFGCAGVPREQQPPAGTGEPLHQVCTLTLEQQALLYRLNGDANALHTDPEVAARAGLARPILHGMCTVGIAVGCVLDVLADLDVDAVRGFTVRMTGPVVPGETLSHRVWSDGCFVTHAAGRAEPVLSAGKVLLA
jgi:acyl dehydratase